MRQSATCPESIISDSFYTFSDTGRSEISAFSESAISYSLYTAWDSNRYQTRTLKSAQTYTFDSVRNKHVQYLTLVECVITDACHSIFNYHRSNRIIMTIPRRQNVVVDGIIRHRAVARNRQDSGFGQLPRQHPSRTFSNHSISTGVVLRYIILRITGHDEIRIFHGRFAQSAAPVHAFVIIRFGNHHAARTFA